MIEVPIPAGWSYENKKERKNGNEVHREYYQDKVVIFCNRLTQGVHYFNIELLPRYSGLYHLNPANVELMYFPTQQGNTGIKTTKIKAQK